MINVSNIHGIGEYHEYHRGDNGEDLIYEAPNNKVFAVFRPKTIELRCDSKLSELLRERYETVMVSRYFGSGGIEIVPSDQINDSELADLVRLSYNLTLE